MGTNYYKVYPLSKETKERLKKEIDNDNVVVTKYDIKFTSIDDLVAPITEVHIGKRSGGWKFLWNHNDWKYFKQDQQSMVDWILDTSDDSIIKNEYGEIISPQEMLDIIDETYDTPWNGGSERYDNKSYMLTHPEEYDDTMRNYFNKYPYEFYVGKYRVSESTEFC